MSCHMIATVFSRWLQLHESALTAMCLRSRVAFIRQPLTSRGERYSGPRTSSFQFRTLSIHAFLGLPRARISQRGSSSDCSRCCRTTVLYITKSSFQSFGVFQQFLSAGHTEVYSLHSFSGHHLHPRDTQLYATLEKCFAGGPQPRLFQNTYVYFPNCFKIAI